jgi:UDP-N-acetylglucosamine 3-dehydrogenase
MSGPAMQRLRVGIIGLGAFGESHIRAYSGLPQVDIAAVASRSPQRAREIAGRYGIPTWYGSHEELIADDTIDAVSVTTAESEHREPAVAALRAGKHVLVEKPLASTLADARAITEAARASSGILMPGHILRFDPAHAAARAAAVSGELGRIVSITARRNRPQRLIATHGRVHPALVTTIHDIDVMLWVAGKDVRRVHAVDRLASRDGGAHGLWGLLEFADGVVGTVETSWLLPESAGISNDDSFEITGLTGTVKVQLDTPALRVWRQGGSQAPDVRYEPVVHGVVGGALRDELSHFASCALAGTPSTIITADDACAALAVVLALIESAATGAPVAVPRQDPTAPPN